VCRDISRESHVKSTYKQNFGELQTAVAADSFAMNFYWCLGLFLVLALASPGYSKCPKERQLCSISGDYNHCEEEQGSFPEESTETNLIYCDSMFCEPEAFQHDYIVSNHDQTPHQNKWKRARIGERATLHDVCVLRNGMPVTRECKFKDYRAVWESTDHWDPVVCFRHFREHTISGDLNSLHDDILEGRRRTDDSQGRRNMTGSMRKMFRQRDRTLLPADVHMTSQMFGTLMQEDKDAAVSVDLVSVCKEIMSSDSRVLRLSAQLNATNSLLSLFENYMDALPEQMVPKDRCGKVVAKPTSDETETATTGVETYNLSDVGVQALITGNISVFFANPECDGITGIAIFSGPAENRRTSASGFWYRFLRFSEDLDKIKRESGLETAAFLPENLWRVVKNRGASYLIFKVYAHDALFVETSLQRSRRPRSKVISISIPGLKGRYIYYIGNSNKNNFPSNR